METTMKSLKKIFINIIALMMLLVATFSFSACAKEEIITLKVKIGAYDTANSAMYVEDLSLTVNLYRHLAPQTVDKIVEYVKETDNNFYKDAIFYTDDNAKTILVGDLKFEDSQVVQAVKPEIYGEFKSNGTVGSNLKNKKGSIGLWRSTFDSDTSLSTSSDARDSGRATWYMPTESISSYDGFTCIFAQIDLDDSATNTAFNAIDAILSDSKYYDNYVIYYTGEYDENDKDGNHGLEFHCVAKSSWTDGYNVAKKQFNGQDVFFAEGQQLKSYNFRNVKLPKLNDFGQSYAYIKSIEII